MDFFACCCLLPKGTCIQLSELLKFFILMFVTIIFFFFFCSTFHFTCRFLRYTQ